MNQIQSEIANPMGGCVVVHGLNIEEDSKFVGHTVKAIKNAYRDTFNIPEIAKAFVDGEEVPDEYVLQSGETLEFVKESGRKGLGRLFAKDQLLEFWGLSQKQYQALISMGLPQVTLEDEVLYFEYAVDDFLRNVGPIQTTLAPPPSSQAPSDETSQQEVLQSLGRKVDQLHEELMKVRGSNIEKEFYSTNEAALKTGLSTWTLSQACKKGRIEAKKDVYSGKWRIPHQSIVQIQNEGMPPLANS